MRVGILTFHAGPNYGGYFQAEGMARAIAGLGHEVEIINYRNQVHHEGERFKPWIYRRPLRLWHDSLKRHAFRAPVAALPLYPSTTTTNPAEIEWGRYEAIVIGSDIVWNRNRESFGRDEAYFGRFPSAFEGKLIAYAPSIGPMPPDYPMPEWMPDALRRFAFIGARDPNTAAFVEIQTGVRPPVVADPTWLVDPVAPSPEGQAVPAGVPLMVYSFPLTGKYRVFGDAITSFAATKRLRTLATGYYQGWCDRNRGALPPRDWEQLFGASPFVVSGTFHGGLFAIREEAQFCILSHPAIDSKLAEALRVTGLEDRLLHAPEQIAPTLEKAINYQAVRPRRKAYAESSLALLAAALS